MLWDPPLDVSRARWGSPCLSGAPPMAAGARDSDGPSGGDGGDGVKWGSQVDVARVARLFLPAAGAKIFGVLTVL